MSYSMGVILLQRYTFFLKKTFFPQHRKRSLLTKTSRESFILYHFIDWNHPQNYPHKESSILGLLLYSVLLFQFRFPCFFSFFNCLDMVKKCTEFLKELFIDSSFRTICLQFTLKLFFPIYRI